MAEHQRLQWEWHCRALVTTRPQLDSDDPIVLPTERMGSARRSNEMHETIPTLHAIKLKSVRASFVFIETINKQSAISAFMISKVDFGSPVHIPRHTGDCRCQESLSALVVEIYCSGRD
jgi:hypothetical protein